MRQLSIACAFLALLAGAAPASRAQNDQGPMAPPPKFEVKRIPSVPHPGPPPIPVEEIIRRFSSNQDAAKKVYESYNLLQTVRVEELDGLSGKFTVTGELYTKPDGGRFWRVLKPPVSTLTAIRYTFEDVRTMMSLPQFFLTSDEIAHYDFLYAGQQKLDELNTYVFQVKPKQLSRTRRFFQGVVFVDDQDLAIVETFGKFVADFEGEGTKLPFTLFETLCERFQDKYWLPAYTSSDDYVKDPDGIEVHLRLVIHSSDFKLNSPAAPATPSQTAAPPAPSQVPPRPPQ
jgi:hypothetical protein